MVCIYMIFHDHTLVVKAILALVMLVDSSHEKTTPHTSHVPLLPTEQLTKRFMTPLVPDVSAPSSDRWTRDRVIERFDAEPTSIDIDEATFFLSLSQVQYKQHFWWTKSAFQ